MQDLFQASVTVFFTIFIAELTDKDALLLLTLATRIKPRLAFLAGAVAFTITSAIIVGLGSILASVLPVYWIKIAGGVIMICFAIYEFFEVTKEAKKIEKREIAGISLTNPAEKKRSSMSILISSVSMLVALDLAGDATEVLTIVFVARFQNSLLVFVSCVAALVLASGVETAIGNKLGKFLKPERVRYLSFFVFLIIGLVVIISTVIT